MKPVDPDLSTPSKSAKQMNTVLGATRRLTPSVVKVSKNVGRSISRGSASQRSSGSSSSRSSGGSSRSGGSSSGKTPVAPKSSTPKAPVVPDINSYLGMDSGYQTAVRSSKQSLADFLSEINRRQSEANTQYTQTRSSMEQDRNQQLQKIRDEFASRGLINSGLFGEEQGNFNNQYNQQVTTLDQQQAALLADLLSQRTNYQREQAQALEAAKQEALQRRAAKYNIGA